MKSNVVFLTILSLLLSLALADRGGEWETKTRCQSRRGSPCTSLSATNTTSATRSCTPTATATAVATLSFVPFPTGSPGDGTDLQFGPDWYYIACSVHYSSSCPDGSYNPTCRNKGACGPSSNATGLLVAYPHANPPAVPNFSITPKAPKTGFTIYQLTFTTSAFLPEYPSVSIELKGESMYPESNPLPIQTLIIPKPQPGQYYSRVTQNLPALGYGALKRLDVLAYFTGSDGSGGQGPNGRVFSDARIDYDGSGEGIRYETYQPLGCDNYGLPKKRTVEEEGASVPARVVVKKILEGFMFA